MQQSKYKNQIAACHACALYCDHCVSICSTQSGGGCVNICNSCADMCLLASREMARESIFAEKIAALCAEICEKCANECSKHKMACCADCAEQCRLCAMACHDFANRTHNCHL